MDLYFMALFLLFSRPLTFFHFSRNRRKVVPINSISGDIQRRMNDKLLISQSKEEKNNEFSSDDEVTPLTYRLTINDRTEWNINHYSPLNFMTFNQEAVTDKTVDYTTEGDVESMSAWWKTTKKKKLTKRPFWKNTKIKSKSTTTTTKPTQTKGYPSKSTTELLIRMIITKKKQQPAHQV